MSGREDVSGKRRRGYRRGHLAEAIAAVALGLRGYRILVRRFKTPAGEIDLVSLKGDRLGFVEVKRRATMADCEAAITAKSSQRVRRAAAIWLAQNPQYHGHEQGFDLVFVTPWRWPRFLKNAL